MKKTLLIDKWLENLTSRKYPQAISHLRTEDGYCCLGVLCDTIDPSAWSKSVNSPDKYNYHYKSDTFSTDLSYKLLTEIGLSVRDMHTLTLMNDSGFNFNQIASYIKEKMLQE